MAMRLSSFFALSVCFVNRLAGFSSPAEAMTLEVPELAEPLTPSSAYGGRAIRPHSQREADPCVSKQRLDATAHSCCANNTVVLRLSTAEGQAGLSGGPGLVDMLAKHHASA